MARKYQKRELLYQTVEKWSNQMVFQCENNLLSEHTIRGYRIASDAFVEYIRALELMKKVKLNPLSIDNYFLADFLKWVASRCESDTKHKMKSSTRKLYMVRIGALLRFVSKQKDNPYSYIQYLEDIRIKTPEIIEKYVSEADRLKLVERFISYYEGTTDVKDVQKVLIAKILLFSGVRAAELRGIRFDDFVDEGDCYAFKVFGKGSKERVCYMAHDLSQFVNSLPGTLLGIKKEIEYLSQFKTYVCEIKDGKPMTTRSIWNYTKYIFKESGIKMTGIHCFRHGVGRMLTAMKTPLTVTQGILGHSDIKVTSRYAKADEAMKKAALV